MKRTGQKPAWTFSLSDRSRRSHPQRPYQIKGPYQTLHGVMIRPFLYSFRGMTGFRMISSCFPESGVSRPRFHVKPGLTDRKHGYGLCLFSDAVSVKRNPPADTVPGKGRVCGRRIKNHWYAESVRPVPTGLRQKTRCHHRPDGSRMSTDLKTVETHQIGLGLATVGTFHHTILVFAALGDTDGYGRIG